MIEIDEGEVRVKGRGLSKGTVTGFIIKSDSALSLADDINLKTGRILDKGGGIFHEPIKDRVLVFPHSKKIMDYHNPIHELKTNDVLPRAIVTESLDAAILQDAADSNVPAVDEIDISVLATGDEVVVDGTIGFVSLKHVTLKNVATSVLTYKDRVLILRRSDNVGTYQGRWACVSGYVEMGENAEDTAPREIKEETGLGRDDCELVRKGKVLYARDKDRVWAVHPFLFRVKKSDIALDWEHIDYKWIAFGDIKHYATVPKLRETIESVLMDDGDNIAL